MLHHTAFSYSTDQISDYNWSFCLLSLRITSLACGVDRSVKRSMITDVDCWILKLLMSVINIEQTCINTVALIKHYSSFEHCDHSDTGLTNGASLRQAILFFGP